MIDQTVLIAGAAGVVVIVSIGVAVGVTVGVLMLIVVLIYQRRSVSVCHSLSTSV